MKVKIKPCEREYLQEYYDGCERVGLHHLILPTFVNKLLTNKYVEIDSVTSFDMIIYKERQVLDKRFVNIVKERTENAQNN